MYSFEGEFRRRPVQSLGGVSKHQQRDILLQRAQLERQKREEIRKHNQCAIVIQAFFRGCKERAIQKKRLREEFEYAQSVLGPAVDLQDLTVLMGKLNFFFNKKIDSAKLVWVSQNVIRKLSNIVKLCQREEGSFIFCFAQFLDLTLKLISYNIVSNGHQSKDVLGSHWRVLEVYLNLNNWIQTSSVNSANSCMEFIFGFLINKGYFKKLKEIIDIKVPPLVEATVRPPTPLSACLVDLLMQPLEMATMSKNAKFSNIVTTSFSKEFLEPVYSEAVAYFILPNLGSKNDRVPVVHLLEIHESAPANPWLLHSLLVFSDGHPTLKIEPILRSFVMTLSQLTGCLRHMQRSGLHNDDDDSDHEDSRDATYKAAEQEIMRRSIDILNGVNTVQVLVAALQISSVLTHLCTIAHNLLLSDRMALHNHRLLYTLAFKPHYLQQLLEHIKCEKQQSLFGPSDNSLIQLLAKGVNLTFQEIQRIVPVLDVFCSLFSHLLVTLDDSEFFNESVSINGAMPFTLPEIVDLASTLRDVCLGLVEVAYPDSRPNTAINFSRNRTAAVNEEETRLWMHLFKSAVNLLRQLHTRDTRRPFCPNWVWITRRVSLPTEGNGQLSLRTQSRLRRPFRSIRHLTRSELEEEGNALMSTREIRTLAILRETPFVFSFTDRVKMWQLWIMSDRMQQQTELNFPYGPLIHLNIRRNYIYEDAFEKLSIDNEPNMRWKMRIQLMNAVGLEEAGVDGGGIFREFLSELLKICFDPNRGFFRLTHDNLLYPNPDVAALMPDFPKHYFFIGRMLGKALYENLLVELPLADFFLSKILGQASASLDVHHLASLDPVLHKNLLYLRHYDGEVTELGLDFTIVSSVFGETKVEELKPNGANIPVTSSNRIEYIHLVADYKLNKQIRLQCNAFQQGLANVVDMEWLQTFSYRELQVLISGAYTPIDIDDLKKHTNYSGGYTSVHPVIINFWKIVSSFDDEGKRQLLKFVTSCSRPPLFGFKELDPPFCIQNAGIGDRLPTASTCMNLLKLPEFHDENVLREKLLYALASGAGFELS